MPDAGSDRVIERDADEWGLFGREGAKGGHDAVTVGASDAYDEHEVTGSSSQERLQI